MRSASRPPWYFLFPAFLVAGGVTIPLVYLVIRALGADISEMREILWRTRNLELLFNTLLLVGGVLVVCILISLPLAWLTARSSLPGRRVVTLLAVLPLAVPGYVMAYAYLGATGHYGLLERVWGLTVPRPGGYWGALLAISLYTYPYLFLNLRAALLGVDASQEDAARSLGYRSTEIFFRVILPQLRPALYAGGLIVSLYVLGDFGAVSLMRYETFSYAIFLQFSAYDRVYVAWLALMLLALTLVLLLLESRLLRGVLFHRVGSGAGRITRTVSLGWWQIPAWLFLGILFALSLGLPLWTVAYWMQEASDGDWQGVGRAFKGSLSASLPAAFLASALALPIAYVGVRYPSRATQALERMAYFGYALPPLAFAFALAAFSLSSLPFLYQTLGLLVFAYTIHFLAEAVGPIRSSLYQAPPRLEETARTLGCNPFAAFFRVTFPQLRKGLVAGTALVFLSAMKELPLTYILSPVGFDSLAINVWSYAGEAMFAEAAPFALALLFFSGVFVAFLLLREQPS